jgi:hypothetical protein
MILNHHEADICRSRLSSHFDFNDSTVGFTRIFLGSQNSRGTFLKSVIIEKSRELGHYHSRNPKSDNKSMDLRTVTASLSGELIETIFINTHKAFA